MKNWSKKEVELEMKRIEWIMNSIPDFSKERRYLMEQPVCAVFDKQTGLYDAPFTCRHVAEAIREWDVVRKDPNNKYGKHPEVFELQQIAVFKLSTAKFENLPAPSTLATGV